MGDYLTSEEQVWGVPDLRGTGMGCQKCIINEVNQSRLDLYGVKVVATALIWFLD
jgi:hypothetical protein